MPDIVLGDFRYLEEYKTLTSKKEFWLDVTEQISKDFNYSFSVKPDDGGLEDEHTVELFVKELERQLPSFTPRFSEILYRIDVPEAQMNALKNVPDDIYFRCLAEIILRRIILKVILRKYYSENKD